MCVVMLKLLFFAAVTHSRMERRAGLLGELPSNLAAKFLLHQRYITTTIHTHTHTLTPPIHTRTQILGDRFLVILDVFDENLLVSSPWLAQLRDDHLSLACLLSH